MKITSCPIQSFSFSRILSRLIGLLTVCAGLLSHPLHAAVFSWSGGGGGNAYWSNSANWGFVGTPGNGDTVIFSASQPNLLNTNDIAGLTLNRIVFVGPGGGYDIRGNAFTLTNNIEATNSAGANTIENNITLAGADQIVDVTVSLTLSGVLSGSVGLIKNGAGTLLINGPFSNTYGGTTTVNSGLVQLAKNGAEAAAIPGNLVIGNGSASATVQNTYPYEIVDSANLTINNNGLWDLNGNFETIGTSLTLNGSGSVSVETGYMSLSAPSTITVNGGTCNINGTGSVQLGAGPCGINVTNGTLNVYPSVQGTASITKTGGGNLYLYGANTYTGLTTVSQGYLWAENNLALGTTNSGTIVGNGASLVLDGSIGITNEALTLNGPGPGGIGGYGSLDVETGVHTWAGPIINNANSTLDAWSGGSQLHINGPISGAGGLELFSGGGGTQYFEGAAANTYAGLTTVDAGCTLQLNKSPGIASVPGNLVVNNGATVRLGGYEQTANTADVLVNGGGLFDFSTFNTYFDTLHGTGTVNFGVLGWIYLGLNNGSSEFDGTFTGTGYAPGWTVGKTGSGTFTIGGNSTYTAGITHVLAGKVVINGSQPQIPVTVDPGSTLGGSGTVSTILANGMISPGNSPGILNSSNVNFSSTGNFTVELTGPNPGVGGYDQLNVAGTVSLANATLTVVPAFTTPVALGQQFVIINNDLADAITGTFSGLPQGSTITVSNYKFTISYVGGDGNDVVLTLTSIPGGVAGSTVTSGNGSHGIDPNDCNNLSLVITNTTGTPMTGINATLSTTTEGVLITQPYSPYPNVAANGQATNTTPFQISTLSDFVCGTAINLQLSVDSSLGSFTMNFVLQSGEPAGAPSRYDVTGNVAIPDIGTVDSTNVVSGFTDTPLEKVVVSLYLTHQYDSDLTNISLISPDGTTVLLSSANGGSGQNYGSGLTPDSLRTTFDDAAATPITSGVAPFVGTFRPQSPLSAFIGNATPNGTWHLHIADGFGGSLGTLRGWSLFLYGTSCSTGSGICDVCMPVISDAITASSPVQTNRWFREDVVSSCGAPKAWDGFGDTGPSFHYNAYLFTNTSGADACVTVELQSSSDVMAAIYLNSYDPTTISNNFLGDAGDSTVDYGGTTTFSSTIPAGAPFIVVVNEVVQNSGTQPYTLQLSGLPCPTPTLNIQPVTPSQARLYWSTAAGGYLLEGQSNLVSSAWATVTNEPIVNGGNYNVTNSAVNPTNQFYRLHKP